MRLGSLMSLQPRSHLASHQLKLSSFMEGFHLSSLMSLRLNSLPRLSKMHINTVIHPSHPSTLQRTLQPRNHKTQMPTSHLMKSHPRNS